MIKMKLRKLAKNLFEGEMTIRKTEFWLIACVCMLAGVVHGLLAAPMTHGITIGSNNNNGNISGMNGDGEEEGEEE